MNMSKFVEGMRVAKVSGFNGHHHTEAFVEKVYKNGNFVLRGDETKKQWKLRWNGERAEQVWARGSFKSAYAYATYCVVWDASFDKWLADEAAKNDKVRRANAIEETLRRAMQNNQLRFASDELLTELEAVVEKFK